MILQKGIIKVLRWVLAPFSLLYAIVMHIRNLFFDMELLESAQFDIPVIAVGNLSVGGTGKTPQIEYLIRLLENDYHIAVLSRGYKRKSEGFVLADEHTVMEEIGDEPFQFFKKFKNIKVAVDTDRAHGIKQLLSIDSNINLILLDDAFQHRKVKASFYTLLTSYDKLYTKDFVLPLGDLRESRSGAKRANVIVVTKCPKDLSENAKIDITNKIKPKRHQKVFFSSITYDEKVQSGSSLISIEDLKNYEIVLVTGIAKPEPLLVYLKSKGISFQHIDFPDHHNFEASDIDRINNKLHAIRSSKKIFLTTEKDYTRLSSSIDNLYSLGIKTNIDDSNSFDDFIKMNLAKF